MKTTWRKLIERALAANHETFADVVSGTFKSGEMDVVFDDDYGTAEGVPFHLWTQEYVYFSAEYDGADYVMSAPRNPFE